MKQQIPSAGGRVAALDGLRGLAAATVVVHHCMLVSAPVLAVVQDPTSAVPFTGEWWAARTPLHLFWAGGEAVIVFFVMSGFVLALPFLSGRRSWCEYYVRRAVRLYLPVWASLAVAALLIAAVPRVASEAQSHWVQDRVTEVTAGQLFDEAILWSTTNRINGPLWSLHWEMLFSALLPLYLAAGFVLRRWWMAKVAVLIALMAAGALFDVDAMKYLPVFGLGVLLAVEQERVARWAHKRTTTSWVVLVAFAVMLLLARWWGVPGAIVPAAMGAAMLVVAFQHAVFLRRFGEAPAAQWLGARSFSLYLVHEPIVVTIVFLTVATTPLVPVLVGIPLSLGAAAAMYAVVERPSQQLARWAGRAALGLWRTRPAATGVSGPSSAADGLTCSGGRGHDDRGNGAELTDDRRDSRGRR